MHTYCPYILAFVLFFMGISPLSAQQDENKTDPIVERLSISNRSGELLYENPISNLWRYNNSFSRLEGNYNYSDASKPLLMQLGNGHNLFGFHADTYLRFKDNSVVWGVAEYTNGKRMNVGWSETSDFLRVYPYVTADTLGGNFNRESYLFKGGYARRCKRISFGVEMAYSSAMEYRKKDPRPKNNAVYINATLGLSWNVNANYQLGGFVFAERYTQNQNIAFLDPIGSISVYHMQGLGMHYARFAGSRTDANYKGRTFRVGVNLQPQNRKGIEASIKMDNYHLQKQLPALKDAPINDISQWKFDAEVTWRQPQYFVTFSGMYSSRGGKERIYDDGVSNWKEISFTKPYHSDNIYTSVKGGYEWFPEKMWSFQLLPGLSFYRNETNYKPLRKQVTGGIDVEAAGAVCYHKKNHLLSFQVGGSYMKSCLDELRIDNPHYFDYSNSMVHHNFEMLSSDLYGAQLSAIYHYRINRIISTIYLKAQYSYHSNQVGYKQNLCQINVGLTL